MNWQRKRNRAKIFGQYLVCTFFSLLPYFCVLHWIRRCVNDGGSCSRNIILLAQSRTLNFPSILPVTSGTQSWLFVCPFPVSPPFWVAYKCNFNRMFADRSVSRQATRPSDRPVCVCVCCIFCLKFKCGEFTCETVLT